MAPGISPLVVAADVDKQDAVRLRGERLGGRWAARQQGPGLHQQFIGRLGSHGPFLFLGLAPSRR
jgi:hypothetical protein